MAPSRGLKRDASKKVGLKERANQLLTGRQKLPIWTHQDEIRAKLQQNDLLLLVSETGSGKSTQIPQFLVNEKWCRVKTLPDGKKVGGCIAITQPRRVAAVSLARRVAEEMGSPLGSASPASEVGYSVRFDNSTSPSTRIKFLTEGMLLQEMLRDPWLKEYSAVVVDEVHERGVNVDLVLAFLRQLLVSSRSGEVTERKGAGIKVVVMSATADMERIKDFFDPKPQTELAARSSKITSTDEPASEERPQGDSDKTVAKSKSTGLSIQVKSLFIKGRRYPVKIHYSPQPVADIIDASLERITDIHRREPLPGDILVFMTGQETVDSLFALVQQYGASIQKDRELASSLPRLLILPLYAALPSHLQQRIFEPTPKFTRKVIIATNIAETSITVPGVRHVIDCGKSKRRLFRPSLNLDSLLTAPISRSSANQRSGRAGRDAPGNAYRLYTEAEFYRLAEDTEPEILRCDLSQLVITLKSHNVEDLKRFPLLTRPPKRALERAIMKGDEDDEESQDSRVRLRRQFYRREGDHLTILATVQAYVDENVDRKRWCEERAINHRAMQAVMDAISIHPSSVLFGRKVEAIMSSEFVFTTKPYARCVSAVQLGWVAEAASAVG
ncbi:hypothetical protein DV738_g1728, partial [Chaetothyriales sp. CBS 135597]